MTPLDFLEFRDLLVPASGFQSTQFRLLEIKMGLKSSDRIYFKKQSYKKNLDPSQEKILSKTEKQASLFDGVNNWLNRMPFLDLEGFKFWDSYQKAVSQSLQSQKNEFLKDSTLTVQEKKQMEKEYNISHKNFIAIFDKKKHDVLVKNGKRRLSYKAMQASLLIFLYRDEPVLHLPFKLLTNLIDMEKHLTSWRHLHSQMALRMIGRKTGTGGSPGYSYLKATVDSKKIFSDFMDLTTYFLPRSKLPKLPKDFQKNLGFYYAQLDDNK
jgi:tryptophan 2,3-dioxygenase